MRNIMHRLFFAHRPPEEPSALIGTYRDAIDGGHGHVSDERIHVTLGITDDFEDEPKALIPTLMEIGDEIAADPFCLSLNRLSASPSSVALRPSRAITGLNDLQGQIDRRLQRRQIRRRGWNFNPHTTLLYRKGTAFQRSIPPVVWQATDFVLIHSIVGATQHIELGRWPLIARQGSLPF